MTVVKMNMPISIVENEAFVRFCSSMNNRFRVPCRQTLTNKIIPQQADSIKRRLKDSLQCIQHCGITCDGWTSKANNSYLGKLTSFLLLFVSFFSF